MSTAEAPGRLHLGYRLDAGVAVVTVTGEVDLVTCGVLRDGLLRTMTDDNGRALVVNLAGVSFLDSTGLGVLVGVWHRVEASGGRLAVAVPSRQVRRALNTAGLTKALSVYDLEADAVQACRHPAAG
jgi:anti-sigma B factor antagonist